MPDPATPADAPHPAARPDPARPDRGAGPGPATGTPVGGAGGSAAAGGRAGPGAGLLAAVGGLVLVAAGTAAWVRAEGLRDVGDVAVPQAVATPGSALAPGLAATGIAALLAGLVLLVVRGRARRWLGLAVLAIGAAALAATVAGWSRPPGPGALAGGPGTAAAGVAAVVAGACSRAATAPRTGRRPRPAVRRSRGPRQRRARRRRAPRLRAARRRAPRRSDGGRGTRHQRLPGAQACDAARARVALAQAEQPLADVLRAADRRPPVPSLAAALAAPGSASSPR